MSIIRTNRFGDNVFIIYLFSFSFKEKNFQSLVYSSNFCLIRKNLTTILVSSSLLTAQKRLLPEIFKRSNHRKIVNWKISQYSFSLMRLEKKKQYFTFTLDVGKSVYEKALFCKNRSHFNPLLNILSEVNIVSSCRANGSTLRN